MQIEGTNLLWRTRPKDANIKLSILIPTTADRKSFNDRISYELCRQANENVEIVWDYNDGTTGSKRNNLIKEAHGLYIAFVDSDDMITDCYIKKQLDVANSGLDCGSLNGLYFLNGVYGKPFIHSNKYTHWYNTPEAYIRTVNHLNCIKRDIALQIPYENITVGEDGRYSEALKASGLIKTEYQIKETLYLYYDRTK